MPDKREYLTRELESLEVRDRSVAGLLDAMGRTGFQGKSLALAAKTVERMIRDPETTVFLGYAGSMSTTGQWKLIRWLIENRYVDVVVSTGANITEDVVEELGFHYYQGTHLADDRDLVRNLIDRYYDVYVSEAEYREMETFLTRFLESLPDGSPLSSAQFLNKFGKFQADQGLNSLTAAAYRAGVPVFSPALADSGFGVASYLLGKRGGKTVAVDQFADFRQLGRIGELAAATGVIYIGGGVPKDTVQLVSVMSCVGQGGAEPVPHKYAVQVTTDSAQWGGLSGCTFEEAISWGKITERDEDRVVCYCDATIALPLIVQALSERGLPVRKPIDLNWVFEDL